MYIQNSSNKYKYYTIYLSNYYLIVMIIIKVKLGSKRNIYILNLAVKRYLFLQKRERNTKRKIKAKPYRNKWVTKICTTTLFQKCHNLMVCIIATRMMKLRDKLMLERVVPYTCQMSV